MTVRPLHDRIIVQRIEEEEQRVGGIIIPDTAKEKPQQGKVINVGKGRIEKDGKNHPARRQDGRPLPSAKCAGQGNQIEGNEYLIIREEEVLGVIEK
jgi:chaperonin GroES